MATLWCVVGDTVVCGSRHCGVWLATLWCVVRDTVVCRLYDEYFASSVAGVREMQSRFEAEMAEWTAEWTATLRDVRLARDQMQ